MLNKLSKSNKITLIKNIQFFSLGIPLVMTMWELMIRFPYYLNPFEFQSLPSFIRVEHITSLFYRNSLWDFPFGLIPNIGDGVPISLTNNIPILAIIYKLFHLSYAHYFGIWLVISFILCVFFAHRICKNVFPKHPIAAGLGALLFLYMPFLWYHPSFVPWMAGQWSILWAYSLYFKKQIMFSREWYLLLIISCLINPFFALVNIGIFISHLSVLYIYYRKITALQAAKLFGMGLTICILVFSILGTFYLQTFSNQHIITPPLSFQNILTSDYNISYNAIGRGVAWGTIFCILLSTYFSRTKAYLNYYSSFIVFGLVLLFYSAGGGIEFSPNFTFRYSFGTWYEMYFRPIFTSGPRFLLPLLFLFPTAIVHTANLLEKSRKHLGIFILIIFLMLQMANFKRPENIKVIPFTELSDPIKEFITESKHFNWIYFDSIPLKPDLYESFAYYAHQNNKTINMIPITRYPSRYKEAIALQRLRFYQKEFPSDTLYIMPSNMMPNEYFKQGESIKLDSLILFKPNKE